LCCQHIFCQRHTMNIRKNLHMHLKWIDWNRTSNSTFLWGGNGFKKTAMRRSQLNLDMCLLRNTNHILNRICKWNPLWFLLFNEELIGKSNKEKNLCKLSNYHLWTDKYCWICKESNRRMRGIENLMGFRKSCKFEFFLQRDVKKRERDKKIIYQRMNHCTIYNKKWDMKCLKKRKSSIGSWMSGSNILQILGSICNLELGVKN